MTTIFSSCGGLHYATVSFAENQLIVPKSEFWYFKKEKKIWRNFVLVESAVTNFPICLYKTADNKYSASLLQCTHQSCELNVGGGIYSCPCHGSEFSIEGKVLEGPADKDLKTYLTQTDDENIFIQLY